MRTYQVTGMTCQHCVDAVTEEVGEVAGVTAVSVDLAAGRLDVESAEGTAVSDDAVRAAVEEAGYALA